MTQQKTKEAGTKGCFNDRIPLIDIYGFADQEKTTYGLRYTYFQT